MKILVATRIGKDLLEAERGKKACTVLHARGHDVTHDGYLDWTNRKGERHTEKYARMIEPFEGLVLVEDKNQRLARGQFTLAQLAFEKGKKVWVWRGNAGHPVKYVTEDDITNWKEGYGKAII